MYAAEYKDYESYPDAEVPQGEESPQTEIINWDATGTATASVW